MENEYMIDKNANGKLLKVRINEHAKKFVFIEIFNKDGAIQDIFLVNKHELMEVIKKEYIKEGE